MIAVVALIASTSRVAPLVGTACLVLALLNLPFLIWSWTFTSSDGLPPGWLLRNPIWFPVPRLVALGWILLLGGAAAIALSERRPSRPGVAFPRR